MRIAIFITCFNDALFPGTGKAVVRILEALGLTPEFPPAQTCCGQIHFNTGYHGEGLKLAERFLEVFRDYDAVVAPSASCVSMVRDQYPVLAAEEGHGELQRELKEVARRTFEFSEFLTSSLGVEDLGATFPHPVAYHPTCHSTRGIDVGDAPLKLLRFVQGLELVPLTEPAECCGFGGTFSVKNPDTSLAMMADKIEAVRASGAAVLTAVDNSCLMHLAGGMRRLNLLCENGREPVPGKRIRVMHLAEILAAESGEGV